MATSKITSNADYVVEQGTSGIWTYRKWNSGVAECWGVSSVSKACTGANGALYDNSGSQALPFAITDARAFTNSTLSGSWFGQVSASASSTTSLALGFVCSTNTSQTWTIRFYVIGKWK